MPLLANAVAAPLSSSYVNAGSPLIADGLTSAPAEGEVASLSPSGLFLHDADLDFVSVYRSDFVAAKFDSHEVSSAGIAENPGFALPVMYVISPRAAIATSLR